LAQIAAQAAGQTTAQLQQLRTTTLEHLQNWLTTHPHDAGAWQQLARVATAQNQVLRGIYAEAEAQAAALDYPAAVDRFRAGQDFARSSGLGTQPGDHIETSIIDTRLREVQTLSRDLLREQAQQR
jgi:predicted Zn-dependent protease